MNIIKFILCITLCFTFTFQAKAQNNKLKPNILKTAVESPKDDDDIDSESEPVDKDEIKIMPEKTGFTYRSYRPTQFLWSNQTTGMSPDYNHLEMNLSPEFHWVIDSRWTLGLVYNGVYGFYWGTLYSSPVISRVQNPFLYTEHGFGKAISVRGANGKETLAKQHRIGLVVAHESNGMMIDDPITYTALTNPASKIGQQESQYHDYNSMGWNYLAIHYRAKLKNNFHFFDQGEISFEYRMYTNQSFGLDGSKFFDLENHLYVDTAKTGLGSAAFNKLTIRNYDGIRFYINEEKFFPTHFNTIHKLRMYYQLYTGFPINNDWGNSNSYKISHKFEVAFGLQRIGGWGTAYFILGHEEGYKKYLSNYPYFRSTWYLGLEIGF